MRKIKNTFGENLEQIEIAKLRLKYEELGYDFFTNKRFPKHNLILDAYARNPETKEEIIFEVKAKESIKKGDTEKLVARREQLLKYYPKARFVLVLANEPSKKFIDVSSLNTLFFDYLKNYELNKEQFKIIMSFEPLKIESLITEKIDFEEFGSIKLEGYGNLIFKHFVKDENFEGNVLSDGIPFQFKIKLINNFEKKQPFSIDKSSKFTFDISEFKI